MPSPTPTPNTVTLVQPQAHDTLEAFERVEAEIRAIAARDLVIVNLDVPSAVATALGALPEIRAFREEMTAIKGVDITCLDKLHDYGFALLHAQTAYRGASGGSSDSVGALAEELFAIRDQLFSDAQALGKRKLLDLAHVEKYRSGLGFKNLAVDVNGLVKILRDNVNVTAGKTAVTAEDLNHAAKLAGELIIAVGMKEQAPAIVTAVTLVRQQAFTLFTHAYNQLRRAMSFLRWDQGDVDTIAPSLWAGRGGRKTPEPETTTPAPAVTSIDGGAANPGADAPATQPVSVGLPGASPFSL